MMPLLIMIAKQQQNEEEEEEAQETIIRLSHNSQLCSKLNSTQLLWKTFIS